MKNLKFFFIIISTFALMSIAVGCGGSSTAGTTGSPDNGVVRFKLDGVDWISAPPGHPEHKYEEEAITDGATMVMIEAFAADGSRTTLTVYKAGGVGVGTYPIKDEGMSAFFEFDSEADGFVSNGMQVDNPGSITITELTDEKVVGSFEYLLRNAGNPDDIRQVTEGSFDLRFTYH